MTESAGGRVALVTGAGRNIGRAIALRLARDGADVVVNVRSSRDEAEAVAVEVRATGRRAIVALADVRSPEKVGELVARAEHELGPITILVNNAAVRREAAFADLPLEEWRSVLAIVLDGAFVCTQAVLPGMVRAGWGRIINIAGMTGQTGATHRAHVVTAKAGIIGLTRALALELAGHGITVNAVSPGMIDTVRNAGSSPIAPRHHQQRVIPVGRRGSPDDVAAVVAFLASDEAAFITGQTQNVNGGVHLSS